ncbi:unnamed protein product [Tuber aestivum]|uniref:Uncharacterized protein n=1 Tax=Tuber aestivum TaxID=59557 RepID=A0A292PVB0_9PEZI|nr:unnamed protein product [Tuber aestivum]
MHPCLTRQLVYRLIPLVAFVFHLILSTSSFCSFFLGPAHRHQHHTCSSLPSGAADDPYISSNRSGRGRVVSKPPLLPRICCWPGKAGEVCYSGLRRTEKEEEKEEVECS